MHLDLHTAGQNVMAIGTAVGLKILGALVLFFVGRSLIRFSTSFVISSLNKQKIDHTLVAYAGTSLTVTLNIVLVVAILGFFGVETTSFAALLAGVGLAIGAAWSGLLANFAAGVFLVVLRPFRVGDRITAGGVTGTVESIGLFVTSVNTLDNILTHMGNNKIFSDTIQNYSTNPYRRVELEAQLDHSVDAQEARQRLLAALPSIANVLPKPAPEVEVLKLGADGPILAVRPFCHDRNYWQVYFDTNALILRVFAEAGYPHPEPTFQLKTAAKIA